jgi:alkylation response protein AidB-like acyl-CoA dehydrogenase
MDFALTDQLAQLADDARQLGEEVAADRAIREDSWIAGFDRSFSEELGRRGWLGMTWPTEVGGGGRPPLERLVVTEALITAGAPLAATWVGDRQIGPTLITYGTPEQQARYLPPMIAGTSTWCIGMSEPDAGSDLAGARTRATSDGDGFVVNGSKIWTSFADRADHIYLIARTGEAPRGHDGMSELIVDMDTPGITVEPIVDANGERHFCQVTFEDVHVGGDRLVGTLHHSWKQVMRQLEHERAGIDRLLSNRALYEEALAVADRRDPVVRQEIAAIETGFRIGRILVVREVLQQAPRSFSAGTKVYCTEHEQRVASFIASTLGPAALIEGRVGRAWMYAPAYTIQGGTSEVLRTVLGERVLGLPKEPTP